MSNIRERIAEYGFETCFDYELLSVLTSVRTEKLREFKSLSVLEERVEMLDCTEIQKAKLMAFFTMAKRYSKCSRGDVKTIKTPDDVYRLVVDDLRFEKREIFKCILLNTKNGVIDIVNISIGSLSSSIVHPRESFKNAVLNSASSVVFVHHHPSNNPEPSTEDITTSKRLAECGELLGIKVLDSIIIGGNSGKYVSLKERGLM